MVTADEIRSRTFLVALRGYDRDEVKSFLRQVADDVAALHERVQELEAAEAPAHPAEGATEEAGGEPATEAGPAPEPSPPQPSPFAEIGEQTQRILEAAQEAAGEIRTKARAEAARELKQARSQATRIIAEGERRREDGERVVEGLRSARAELSEDLRGVGRTIERLLRELGPEPAAATVREALAATAREEAAVEAGGEAPPGGAVAEDGTGDEDASGEAGAAGDVAATGDDAAVGGEGDLLGAEPGPGAAGADDETAPGAEAAEGGAPAGEEALAAAPDGDGVARRDAESGEDRPREPHTGGNGEPTPASGGQEPAEESLSGTGAGGGHAGAGRDGAEPPAAPAAAGARAAVATAEPAGAEEAGDVATTGGESPGAAFEAGQGLLQRTQALAPLHPRLVRKLKRGLQDLQNATLDLLRRDPERSDVEPFLPDSSAVQTLAALAEEQLGLANAAGIAAGAEATGTPVSLEPSGEALAAQLGSELGGVLVTRLADTLRSGFDAGQGMSALTERVDVVFTRMKSQAAGDVAAVALVRAYEGGQRDAWAACGVTHRRWVRAVEPACTDPRCVDNEAAGPVPVGERFPSRHDAPPVRPGCHCSTAPVRR